MEGVSEFIVGTCQLHPTSYRDVFESKQFPFLFPPHVPQHHFLCGSSAEFYIEPLNPCIDDIDIMTSKADELAFTEDTPSLTEDFCGYLDTITCSQIKPHDDYPGFVELRRLGELRYNWHCKRFEFQQTPDFNDLVVVNTLESTIHNKNIEERGTIGPAVKFIYKLNAFSDMVPCVWCPQWPKEAKNSPFRQRNYGWPTSDNIRKIMQGGCHVVHAKHPACRNALHQWRLSFSGAELCLLQSWSPVQQIVYHLLRFFAKRELIRKNCPKEDEVLCTYHFKTLRLWSCEDKSSEWWISHSVIEICCCLLRKLSEWLKKGYCPNYFIPQANLFHDRMNQTVVSETIIHLKELYHFNILSGWFTVEYMLPILKRVFAGGNTTETIIDFARCLLRICEIMDAEKLKYFDWQFSSGFWYCAMCTFREAIVETGYSFRRFLNTICSLKNFLWKTIDRGLFLSTVEYASRFQQFGKVLFILHAANALRFQKTTYDSDIFTEFIREVSWQPKVVKSKYHDSPKPNETSLCRSGVLFLKAQGLIENLTGLNSPVEFKLTSQWSKELLRNALKCGDSMSRAIRGAAFVYMAALHFSESDNETAIEFCSTVLINRANNDEEEKKTEKEEKEVWEKETLNAGCLFFIDDVVRIIGFYLLFRQIKDNFPYNRRRYLLDFRLTPEVLAHYLIISSKEISSKPLRINYDLPTPTFWLDVILMIITTRNSSGISRTTEGIIRVYQRNDPNNELEASNTSFIRNENTSIQLLLEYSLENMASFYKAICKDFGIHCNVAECYRAAYLYKCRKYPEVLQMCERILDEPDLQSSLKGLAFANVMVLPPLDSYFDSNIQCLLGFHTLVCYILSALNGDFWKIDDNPTSTFQQFFDRKIYCDKSLLSMTLWQAYTIKCHYFIGQHFLARYLMLRCLMDCNPSCSELMLKVVNLKSHLPFEHIIRCFVQQKFRRLQNCINATVRK